MITKKSDKAKIQRKIKEITVRDKMSAGVGTDINTTKDA